jgi:integrase
MCVLELHVVADRLGHADSSTTANIYAHVTDC